jgi:hypothetical protein
VGVVDVVDVIVVLHGLMPAVRSVGMVVPGVFHVGEGVLVVVAIVVAVGVPVVDVVDMTVVIDGDMSAVRSVHMAVIVMQGVVGCGHGASFEWLTASATM